MLRTFVRAALVAALVLPVLACGQQAEPTAPASGLEPLTLDPEQVEKAAKEAEYRKHLDAGTKALAAGETGSALAQLKLALGAKPEGPEAHLQLGRAYAAKKDDAAAVKAYTEAIRTGAPLVDAQLEVDAHMERAAIYERLDKLDDAIADYRRVIAIDTDRSATARAYWLRSDILDRQNRQKNRADFRDFREKAIKLDPAYQKQVTAGDVMVSNSSDGTVTLRIDQFVNPDGTERKFPPDVRFNVRDNAPTYLSYRGEILTARSVRYTVFNQAGTKEKEFTATYKSGMTLEIPIFSDDVPK
jgi:tetratricopeptide (TPR) repeat protein